MELHEKRGVPPKKRAILTRKNSGGAKNVPEKRYLPAGRQEKTQELFRELMPWGGKLNENNRWLRLRELIPWEELEAEYSKYFSENRGRPGLDSHLVLGVICIKHMLKLSDEDAVEQVLENPYMQAFCGLESFATENLFNDSSLSKLRKRLGKKYFRQLEKKVLKVLKERELIKARGIMVDATVFPSNIKYPNDIGLLNDAREWLVKQIKRISKQVGIWTRTYCRKARNQYLSFSKKKKKTKKVIREATKQMLQHVRRNKKQLIKLIEEVRIKGIELKEVIHRKIEIIKIILEQQWDMYRRRSHNVKDRIVSYAQPEVRPQVRGKAGKNVEFGPKGELSLIDNYLFLDWLSFNNFNEANKMTESIRLYEERFEKKPKEIIADGIYGNRDNRKYLKAEGIRPALNPLGRKARTTEYQKEKSWIKKKQRIRNRIEGFIGHAKEHFGLDKIRYKIDGGSEIWVRMGLLMMNLDTALKRA